MTALQLMGVGGMLATCGVVLAIRSLRPAPPALQAALAQLNAPAATVHRTATPRLRGQWDWLPPSIAELLEDHLGVADADLRVLGWTRSQLAARKVALALAGLFTPPILTTTFLMLGINVPFAIPVVAGLVLGGYLWTLPTAEAKEAAAKARAEFRDALDFFLDLIALERLVRGSVKEALEAAAEISGCAPFLRIDAVLKRSALAGQEPWNALRDLGDELDIEELRALGDIAAIAGDSGAKIYGTLLAAGRSLRHATLAEERAQANAASARMSMPVALLTIGLTMFVAVPLILRMIGVS